MMNPQRRLKDGFAGSSSSSYTVMAAAPRPMEGLHDAGPPPFLTKTYDIVEDSYTNHIISWTRGNNSFVVWDPQAFSMSLLPRYFKHNNFSSFVRQLNTYGFRKVDPDRWEFANEGFLRGQRHLLKNIRRRKTTQPQAASQQALDVCVEVGRFGLDGEVDRLKRDKQLLMMELVKLRQQQQNTREYLQVMEQRLRRTEMKQQQMLGFLARAMKNPNFVQQLVQYKDIRKEFEEAITRKRRRQIDQGHGNTIKVGDQLGQAHEDDEMPFVKIEPQEYGDIGEFEVSELDKLAMDMQGLSDQRQKNPEDEYIERGDEHAGSKEKHSVDEVFWDKFLNEDTDEEEIHILDGTHGEEVEDVDVLVEQLGFLSSSTAK